MATTVEIPVRLMDADLMRLCATMSERLQLKESKNTRLEKSKAGGIYQMTPYIMGKPDLDHRYASGSLQDLIWLLVSLFILSCCGIAGCLIQNRVTSYWKRIVPIGLTMLFDVSFSDT